MSFKDGHPCLDGNKNVKGLIIALEDDKNLRDALSVAPNIKFMKYEVSFKLVEKMEKTFRDRSSGFK